jgi:hypothetical protein
MFTGSLLVVLDIFNCSNKLNCGFKFLSLEFQLLLTEYFWHTVMNG